MNTKLRVLFSVFTVLLLALAPMAAMAQETSTSLRVNVTNSDGTPLAGASVLVTDTRNGATRNLTTSETGTVLALGMRIGGPYTVAVTAESGGSA